MAYGTEAEAVLRGVGFDSAMPDVERYVRARGSNALPRRSSRSPAGQPGAATGRAVSSRWRPGGDY
jgi:hypothetical protein